MQQAPVITIDGPGGSGKGTICRLVSQKLGWHLLDSGAIYRVLALAAIHHQIALLTKKPYSHWLLTLMYSLPATSKAIPALRWKAKMSLIPSVLKK